EPYRRQRQMCIRDSRWAVPSESLPGIPGGRGFRGQEPDIRPDPSRGCVEWSLSRPMMQKWENACPPPS
ncbi:hypothetical protein FA366_30275, partial [Pseudomonas aeruginosa]|nr:hypothetical protein [Pseudomonas aeruginosa]